MMMTWKISRPGLCKNWERYVEHIINRRLFWSKRSLMFRKMACWKKIEFVQYQLSMYLNCNIMNVLKRIYAASRLKFMCTRKEALINFDRLLWYNARVVQERNKIKLWYNEIKLWFMYFMQYTANPIWEEMALFF